MFIKLEKPHWPSHNHTPRAHNTAISSAHGEFRSDPKSSPHSHCVQCASYLHTPGFTIPILRVRTIVHQSHSPLPTAEDIHDIWEASPNIRCLNTPAQRLLHQHQLMLAQFLFSLLSLFHSMQTRYSFQPIALGRLPCQLLTCRTIASPSAA